MAVRSGARDPASHPASAHPLVAARRRGASADLDAALRRALARVDPVRHGGPRRGYRQKACIAVVVPLPFFQLGEVSADIPLHVPHSPFSIDLMLLHSCCFPGLGRDFGLGGSMSRGTGARASTGSRKREHGASARQPPVVLRYGRPDLALQHGSRPSVAFALVCFFRDAAVTDVLIIFPCKARRCLCQLPTGCK